MQIGCDDERVMEVIERRYARMVDRDAVCEPVLSAFIISRGKNPGVLIGDEYVRAFDDLGSSGALRLTPAAIEGRAMLAINARIFRLRQDLVVFHAGAIALGDQAAVVVGPTTSGKSTTCLSLLYHSERNRPLSDEFALVNTSSGEVESFPRLFSLRTGTRRLLGLQALDLDWEAVDPAAALQRNWMPHAKRSSFFFIVGRGKHASARQMPLSEAIFLAVGSEVQTTIDKNHLRIVDRVISALSMSKLYALTVGTPQDTCDVIQRLTVATETAVA